MNPLLILALLGGGLLLLKSKPADASSAPSGKTSAPDTRPTMTMPQLQAMMKDIVDRLCKQKGVKGALPKNLDAKHLAGGTSACEQPVPTSLHTPKFYFFDLLLTASNNKLRYDTRVRAFTTVGNPTGGCRLVLVEGTDGRTGTSRHTEWPGSRVAMEATQALNQLLSQYQILKSNGEPYERNTSFGQDW